MSVGLSEGIAPARTVEDLCSLVVDCPHSTPKWMNSGVVVLRSRNIRNGRLDLSAQRSFTTEEGYLSRVKRAVPQAGDLVITREAPMGEVCMLPPGLKCCMGQRMVLLRPDPERVEGRFLLFALQSRQVQFQIGLHEGTGSTVSNLRIPALKALNIPTPPLPEQRRIAAVLGALDDKIELNRKMNKTLEEMGQAIFKRWFIDFDEHTGLVDSELGPIPRGWEVKPLPSIIEINPRTKLQKGIEAPYLEMAALSTTGATVEKVGLREFKGGGSKFVAGDTLLARITPCLENGKTALVDFLAHGEVAFGSTEFIVLRPTGPYASHWVYCLARTPELRRFAISNMTGSSGRQRVPVGCFRSFGVAVPQDQTVVNRFCTTAAPLFNRISANVLQSRTLAELRDTLLPKLISGELRIPEAKAQVEDAL